MLVVVVDPDHRRTEAVWRHLRSHGCGAVIVHDFESAERLLMASARPAALFVADLVPPLSGADLLSLVERNPRLSGVPVVALVRDEESLLALAFRRGGIRTVTEQTEAPQVAALLAERASS